MLPGKLWALRQDFPADGDASIWLNCSVAKLSSGGLLVGLDKNLYTGTFPLLH